MERKFVSLSLAVRLSTRLSLANIPDPKKKYLLTRETILIIKESWDKRLSKGRIAKIIGWSASAVYKRWEEIERAMALSQALINTLSPTPHLSRSKPQLPDSHTPSIQPLRQSEGRWRREDCWP